MRATKSLILVAALVSMISLASTAMAANGPGRGPGAMAGMGGSEFSALTPEKATAFRALQREFRDKTQPIREQIWVKNTSLQALSANGKSEPQQLLALVTEISALRSQLYTEHTAFAERVKKDIGIDMPMHGGMGMGMGMGMGKGDGMGSGWGHRGGGHGGRGGFGGGGGPRCAW